MAAHIMSTGRMDLRVSHTSKRRESLRENNVLHRTFPLFSPIHFTYPRVYTPRVMERDKIFHHPTVGSFVQHRHLVCRYMKSHYTMWKQNLENNCWVLPVTNSSVQSNCCRYAFLADLMTYEFIIFSTAAGQCLFSLGAGMGAIIVLASYNPFRHNVRR